MPTPALDPAPTLVDARTWPTPPARLGCETVCDTNLGDGEVSEPLRYRAPPRCHRLSLPMLLRARAHPLAADTAANCRAPERVLGLPSRCPFEPGLESQIPPNVPTTPAAAARAMARYGRCALVGSGAGAAGHGRAIDAEYDAVVRTNDSPTDAGFDVGRTTTLRVAACWPTNHVLLPMCTDPQFNWPGAVWRGELSRGASARLGNRTLWRITTRNELCPDYEGWGRCSTGMFALVVAMSVCDKQIDVYGMLPTRVDGQWQYSRYYHSHNETVHDGGHRYLAEKAALYALHCAGRIRLLA